MEPQPSELLHLRGGGVGQQRSCAVGQVGEFGPEDALQLNIVQRSVQLLLADPPQGCVADAVGAEQSRVGMHKGVADAQLVRHAADMLRGRSAESHDWIISRIHSLPRGDGSDGAGHVRVGHGQVGHGQFVQFVVTAGRGGDVGLALPQGYGHRLPLQRHGEARRRHAPQPEVHVGHGQRSASPVTGWPWIGPGALRADQQALTVEPAPTAAAGRHRFNRQRGRLQQHTGLPRLVLQRHRAVQPRDIGAGATHVEPDRAGIAHLPSDRRKAHHTASRAAQDAVLAREILWRHQATTAGHQRQPTARAQGPLDLGHVVLQDRVQVSVQHRGAGSRNKLDQRRTAMRQADVREPALPRHGLDLQFVLRITIGMQQTHAQRLDARGSQTLQSPAGRGKVQGLQFGPIGRHPSVDFHRHFTQRWRLLHRQGKQVRPLLVANPQRIGQAPRGHQSRARPRPGQQGVGAASCPQPQIDGRQGIAQPGPQQPPNRQQRRQLIRAELQGHHLRYSGIGRLPRRQRDLRGRCRFICVKV